jgi:hypothetical protein
MLSTFDYSTISFMKEKKAYRRNVNIVVHVGECKFTKVDELLDCPNT